MAQPTREKITMFEDNPPEAEETVKKKPKPPKQKKQKKGNPLPGMLQKTIKDLEKAKIASMNQGGDWEADKDACRGKLNLIIPGFEGIVRASGVTAEGNNRELFRRILNLRV
jgi:hypothetical protein